MRFLVSPCAYKGTLAASQIAESIAGALISAQPDAQIELAPIADGGDGTIDAIYAALGGELRSLPVVGPVDNPVIANWLALNQIAVVELACASGIALLPGGKLMAMAAHTFGLGQVLKHCLAYSPASIYVCVGGSASTDGGAGALTAMGAKFLDAGGKPVKLGGGELCRIETCDLEELKKLLLNKSISINVAVDVVNPLLGENGAARIFGPQKGANENDIIVLDRCLTRFADVLELATGSLDLRDAAGAGAAGGTAFGIAAATGATLIPGFAWLAKVLDLEKKINQCDVVITAEGRLDSQSISGKAIGELAKLCNTYGKPLWAFPAILQDDVDWPRYGIHKAISTALRGEVANPAAIHQAVFKAFKV